MLHIQTSGARRKVVIASNSNSNSNSNSSNSSSNHHGPHEHPDNCQCDASAVSAAVACPYITAEPTSSSSPARAANSSGVGNRNSRRNNNNDNSNNHRSSGTRRKNRISATFGGSGSGSSSGSGSGSSSSHSTTHSANSSPLLPLFETLTQSPTLISDGSSSADFNAPSSYFFATAPGLPSLPPPRGAFVEDAPLHPFDPPAPTPTPATVSASATVLQPSELASETIRPSSPSHSILVSPASSPPDLVRQHPFALQPTTASTTGLLVSGTFGITPADTTFPSPPPQHQLQKHEYSYQQHRHPDDNAPTLTPLNHHRPPHVKGEEHEESEERVAGQTDAQGPSRSSLSVSQNRARFTFGYDEASTLQDVLDVLPPSPTASRPSTAAVATARSKVEGKSRYDADLPPLPLSSPVRTPRIQSTSAAAGVKGSPAWSSSSSLFRRTSHHSKNNSNNNNSNNNSNSNINSNSRKRLSFMSTTISAQEPLETVDEQQQQQQGRHGSPATTIPARSSSRSNSLSVTKSHSDSAGDPEPVLPSARMRARKRLSLLANMLISTVTPPASSSTTAAALNTNTVSVFDDALEKPLPLVPTEDTISPSHMAPTSIPAQGSSKDNYSSNNDTKALLSTNQAAVNNRNLNDDNTISTPTTNNNKYSESTATATASASANGSSLGAAPTQFRRDVLVVSTQALPSPQPFSLLTPSSAPASAALSSSSTSSASPGDPLNHGNNPLYASQEPLIIAILPSASVSPSENILLEETQQRQQEQQMQSAQNAPKTSLLSPHSAHSSFSSSAVLGEGDMNRKKSWRRKKDKKDKKENTVKEDTKRSRPFLSLLLSCFK